MGKPSLHPLLGLSQGPVTFVPSLEGRLLYCSLEMFSAGSHGLGGLSGRRLPDMASACWALSWYSDSCENFDCIYLVNLHKKTVGES